MARTGFENFLDRILSGLILHPVGGGSTAAQLDEQRLAERQTELESSLKVMDCRLQHHPLSTWNAIQRQLAYVCMSGH